MKPKTAGRVGSDSCPTGYGTPQNALNAGLVSGARILTLKGECAVDDLRVADRLLTRSGAVPITRIDVVSLIIPTVYIIAGSLGHSRPDRDALLMADQTVLLRDWRAPALFGQPVALVRASALVDGEFIRDLGQQVVTVHRIFCATPQIFYADGLELGTADASPLDLMSNAA
ncbi:MAG: Hint domain-containing protein [Pseudomonadota bacterium]